MDAADPELPDAAVEHISQMLTLAKSKHQEAMALLGTPDPSAVPRLREVLRLLEEVELLADDASMVAQASGDATPLRFANTEADIWGADLAFGAKIAGPLRIDGVASYVRGKRQDIKDNLYRMAPANGRLALAWEAASWSLSIEGQAVTAQKKLSSTNGEAPSKGYFLANLYGHWLVRDGLRLDFGIENLFDRYYLEHLAGYNRISGSNVPLGMRLPGSGRSAFVKLRWAVP